MKKKILICTLVFALVISALVSCGASSLDVRDEMIITNSKAEAMSPALDYVYAEDSAYGYDGGYYVESGKYVAESVSSGANNGDYKEKIIKNVSIAAQTKEYEKSLDGILSALKQYGGYEESVSSSGRSYYSGDYYTRSARMTLRIPAENLDTFLGEVGNMINVTSQSSSMSNVTSQYYDTKARLEVLEAERKAYEEMLTMAKDVSEVLEIKDRLYKTIEEIEANKTQLNIYDNKVAYSTVIINLDEVKEYVEVPTPKTSFGTRIANSFKQSWKNFADNCQDFAVWFVSALPTILVLAVIIGGGTVIGLVVSKKVRNKKNENDGE